MIDSKFLRIDIHATAERLTARGYSLDVATITLLEAQRKKLQVETQELQNQRNISSKAIGQAKARGDNIESMMSKVDQLGVLLKAKEEELTKVQVQLQAILMTIPNLLHESVPIGRTEEDNVEVERWGEPRKFDFEPKDHVDLGGADNQLDFEAGSKIAGARFVVMRGGIARLHRALIQFMLDVHTQEHAYKEVYVPYIANSASLHGTGQLPKFAEDLFALQGENEFYLIPTAEVPVTNLARDVIFEAKELPMRLVCHTPCFRSEAGSYGKDTRGMIRQHQFEKVELVHFSKPDDSYAELELLANNAKKILQKLNLPYRVIALCSGDIGFAAAKTYDLEVWLPSQKRYREISSCSNTESFQARRIQARWRNAAGKIELIHTLNGSGLAVGRTLVAIMENYQDAEGKIHVPEILWSYMGGIKII